MAAFTVRRAAVRACETRAYFIKAAFNVKNYDHVLLRRPGNDRKAWRRAQQMLPALARRQSRRQCQ